MNGGGSNRKPKMQLNKIMDTSLVTKAKPFSGDKACWLSFAFQFRAHLIASNSEYKGFLKRIEESTTVLDEFDLDEDEVELSSAL